jgi:hypothetical protein
MKLNLVKNYILDKLKKVGKNKNFLIIVFLLIPFFIFFAFYGLDAMRWFRWNNLAIQSVFTVILIIITGYYAWHTKRMADLMMESEKERNRPRINVYLKQSEKWVNFVYLVINNFGNSIARDVEFEISDDLDLNLSNRKLSEVRQIKNGIKNLTPSRELEIPLLSLVGKLEEFKNIDITIVVKYFDALNNQYEEHFNLDISSLLEHQLGEPVVDKIEKHLEKIAKEISRINRK